MVPLCWYSIPSALNLSQILSGVSISLANKKLNDFIPIYASITRKFPMWTQSNICDVLRAISDDKALAIFNTIALSVDSAPIAISRLKLTRKQYYSRMSAMIDANLITRRSGRYFLASFGKVVYEAQMLIGRAQQSYWKLKAVDTFESSSNNTLTPERRDRFINSLIMESEVKRILLSGNKGKENNQEVIALRQTAPF